MILIVKLYIFIILCSIGTTNIVYQTPSYCRNSPTKDGFNQYFEPATMSCLPCSQNISFQTTTINGMRCACQAGYVLTYDFGGDITCKKCPNQQIASLDGWTCIDCVDVNVVLSVPICKPCDNTIGLITVERELNGNWFTRNKRECISCATGTIANDAYDRCIPCSSLNPMNKKCGCPNDNLIKGYCVNNPVEITSLPNSVQLSKLVYGPNTIDSSYFENNTQVAYIFCLDPYNNQIRCQQLANLCILTLYQNIKTAPSDGKDNICTMFAKLVKSSNKRKKRATADKSNVPTLTFSNVDAALSDSAITTLYRIQESQLELLAAVYNLDGTYVNFTRVNKGLLQLCQNSFDYLDAAYIFGTQYEQNCEINSTQLANTENYKLQFYELFLKYQLDDKFYLMPIPIRITNYPGNNDDKSSSWTLMKRFFLVDNVAGIDFATGSLKAIRYAKTIKLVVTMQNPINSRIYPPYLMITYDVITSEALEKNTSVLVSFSVKYTMDYSSYETYIYISLGIFIFFALLVSLIQAWTWSKTSIQPSVSLLLILKFILFLCCNISNAILATLVSSTVLLLIVFKRQFMAVLVINADTFQLFGLLLFVAFVLKVIDLIHLIIYQITIDIYFIDFEKSRLMKGTAEDHSCLEVSASMWRIYFLANEWNEIQTTRKINPLVQYFVTLLFLMAIGFGNIATMDGETEFNVEDQGKYYAPHSKILRFAIITLVFICVAIVQRLFMMIFYERFIENKISQFIDLCSLANVSIFIMDEDLHGYYVHGRSVHGRADIGLREMYENFAKEERDLVGKRGLLPEEDDQIFEIFISSKLRNNYNKIIRPILEPQNAVKRVQGSIKLSQNTKMNVNIDADTMRSIQAYRTINLFLQSFIDHTISDLEYSLARKSFLENILNTILADTSNKSLFYYDDSQSFVNVIFYGHEVKLIIFEILLFTVVDFFFENFFLDAFIVFIVMELLVNMVRDSLGRNNLAKKTLVDKRFLI